MIIKEVIQTSYSKSKLNKTKGHFSWQRNTPCENIYKLIITWVALKK